MANDPAIECEELHERANLLHREADLGLQAAERRGPSWAGFGDQIGIALRCEQLALKMEARIDEEC